MDSIRFVDKRFDTPRAFYNSIDFCVFDESHEYCGPSRNKIFKICQAPYMLGLSATPNEREDKLDIIPLWNLGRVLNARNLPGYTEQNIPFTGRVRMIKYMGPPEYTKHIVNEALEMMSVPSMIDQLSRDPYRMKLIIGEIREHIKKKLNIFVFADRRSYLEKIHAQLEALQLTPLWMTTQLELNAMTVMGGCSAAEVETAGQTANVILTTYQFLSTGTSIPKMNCVILTTPRKTKSRQTIGRIFRLGSNYDIERQIVDIVDAKTALKNQWYMRKKYYMEKAYPIDKVQISWSDIRP
jgi:superfamily II DNA or RNA helicase